MTSIAPDPFADTAAGEPSAVPGRGGTAGGMGRSTDVYENLRLEVLEELGDHSADLQNAGTVQAVVRQVVDGYQARARQGLGIRALATPNEMVARLDRSLLEYGPLTPFLDGTIDYEELMIHGDEVTYIDGLGNLQSYDELTSEGEIRSIVARLLSTIGATVDDSRPIMQAQILGGRARIGVVIPPISDAINVTLRRYVVRRDTFRRPDRLGLDLTVGGQPADGLHPHPDRHHHLRAAGCGQDHPGQRPARQRTPDDPRDRL